MLATNFAVPCDLSNLIGAHKSGYSIVYCSCPAQTLPPLSLTSFAVDLPHSLDRSRSLSLRDRDKTIAMIDVSAWRTSIGLWNCRRIGSRRIRSTKPDHYTGETRTKIKYVITVAIVAIFLLFYKLLKMNPKG